MKKLVLLLLLLSGCGYPNDVKTTKITVYTVYNDKQECYIEAKTQKKLGSNYSQSDWYVVPCDSFSVGDKLTLIKKQK